MSYKTSELVTWSNTFSVGIQIIDDQHKGLLELVNDMFNQVTTDEESQRRYFSEIIQQAVKYIKTHFSTEEEIMTRVNFAGYAKHKKEHESFVLTVVEQAKTYESSKRLALLDFTRFLKEWILTHIAIVDKNDFGLIKKVIDIN